MATEDFCTVRISKSCSPEYRQQSPSASPSTFTFDGPRPAVLMSCFSTFKRSEFQDGAACPSTPVRSPLVPSPEHLTFLPPLKVPELDAGLITPSPRRNRPLRRKDDDRVKRPPNPFILFAADFRKKNKGSNNRELSIRAGELWKDLPKVEKDFWQEKATQAKQDHSKAYPGYRYQPRRSEKPRRPKGKGKAVETEIVKIKPEEVVKHSFDLPPTPVSMPRPRPSAAGLSRTHRRSVKMEVPEDDQPSLATPGPSTSTSSTSSAPFTRTLGGHEHGLWVCPSSILKTLYWS